MVGHLLGQLSGRNENQSARLLASRVAELNGLWNEEGTKE